MIQVGLSGIGIVTDGIASWAEAAAALRNEIPYQGGELVALKPAMLKPNERRRTTRTIKLALQVAEQALQDCPDTQDLLSVFSSSEGDLDIIDQICLALAKPDRPVSPTQFHNSVHNAPAGYWSMGTGSQAGSTSLGGLDGGFATGLIEAATQVFCEQRPALLVCYDQIPPPLMQAVMPIKAPFAVALLLTPNTDKRPCLAHLTLRLDPQGVPDTLAQPELETLRLAAPAARALTLLEAVAQNAPDQQRCLTYQPGLNLHLTITQ
ncbi:MAG: beta-ketoacyl synthase chain length factor [Candidatus Thiodiazotropha sp.]